MEIWEPPACEVCCKGFPSNYNSIDGGGISRDHWGQSAGTSEGHMIQVCVEQARLLIQVPWHLGLFLLFWPLGLCFHEWNYVGGTEQIWGLVQADEGASACAASRPSPILQGPAPAQRPAAGSESGNTTTPELCSRPGLPAHEAPYGSPPLGDPCR